MRIVIMSLIAVCCLMFNNHQEADAQSVSGEVNPADYQFSMNITGVYVSGCVFSGNKENRIYAFAGNELRGSAAFSVGYNDLALAFLTVFSNRASGDDLRFELYDAGMDEILNLPVKLRFTENGIHGSIQAPFQFYDDAPVLTGSLLEQTPGVLWYTGGADGSVYTWYKNETLVGSGDIASLHVCGSGWYKVEVQNGACSLLRDSLLYAGGDVEISVQKELTSEQKLIHCFIVSDCEDSYNSYIYELIPGEGSEDNHMFEVRGDTLVMLSGIDMNRLNYTIRVKATDRFGNIIEQAIRTEHIAVGMADRIAGEVKLYPNPYEGGSLFLTLPDEYGYEVVARIVTMDAMSGEAGQRLNKGVNELHGADKLPPGLYFLELRAGQVTVYKKLIKN